MEKIKGAGALTDADLYKSMVKDGHIIPDDRFNKYLLDLEVMGLARVAWVTKDERRIEAIDESGYSDYSNGGRGDGFASDSRQGADGGNSGDADTSYEASFPGFEK